MDDTTTWDLIHAERAATADALAALAPADWERPSLCAGWTVRVTAGHILVGAEQTAPRFFARMAANGFRFNTMMDRDARRAGELPPAEIVKRLRLTTTTTNRPPAPVMTMLGEIVVHGADIDRAVGRNATPDPRATVACLDMFSRANFPVGAKKRIDGLRLVATDVDWSHGDGPEVSGPGVSLLLAITGRAAGLDGLEGDGVAAMRRRFAAAS